MVRFICFFGLALMLATSVNAQTFKDKDWSTAAYANCGLPKKVGSQKAIGWTKVGSDRKLAFILSPGQVGTCSTDNRARHGAPYWERAEVKQKSLLSMGRLSRISFEATFLEGFVGRDEAFFQIHGWADKCPAYPPFMFKMDGGRLKIDVLRGVKGTAGQTWISSDQGSHRALRIPSVKVSSLYGKPQVFEVSFDTRRGSPGALSVSMNGKVLVSQAAVEFAPCAKPHFKIGIYRPGQGRARSALLIDDVKLTEQ